jgi:hypothetical protein
MTNIKFPHLLNIECLRPLQTRLVAAAKLSGQSYQYRIPEFGQVSCCINSELNCIVFEPTSTWLVVSTSLVLAVAVAPDGS